MTCMYDVVRFGMMFVENRSESKIVHVARRKSQVATRHSPRVAAVSLATPLQYVQAMYISKDTVREKEEPAKERLPLTVMPEKGHKDELVFLWSDETDHDIITTMTRQRKPSGSFALPLQALPLQALPLQALPPVLLLTIQCFCWAAALVCGRCYARSFLPRRVHLHVSTEVSMTTNFPQSTQDRIVQPTLGWRPPRKVRNNADAGEE